MFVARGLETIWYRGDTALLGLLSGTLVLGFYDRGRYLAEFGHYVVSFAAVQVAFPVYSRLQGRPDALTYAYRLSHGVLVRLMFPVLIWLAFFPNELVGLLFGAGNRWAETASLLPWFAVFGFLFPVVENVKVLLTGIGRLSDSVRLRVVQLIVTLPLLVPAIRLAGPQGAATVMVLSEVAGLIAGYRALRHRVSGLYLGSYARPAIAAAVATAVISLGKNLHLLPWTGRMGYVASLGAAGGLYVICLFIIDRQEIQDHLWALLAGLRGETPPEWTAEPLAASSRPPAGPDIQVDGRREAKITVPKDGA